MINRKTSAIKIAIWISVFIAFRIGLSLANDWLKREHLQAGLGLIIIVAIPGAFALVNIIELITGRPFKELAKSWEGLKGWQRGVISAVVLVATLFLTVVIAALLSSDSARHPKQPVHSDSAATQSSR